MNTYAKLLEPVNNIEAGMVGKVIKYNYEPLHQTITRIKLESVEIEFNVGKEFSELIVEVVKPSQLIFVKKTSMQELIDFIIQKSESEVFPVAIEDVYEKAKELKLDEVEHIKNAYDSPRFTNTTGQDYFTSNFID
jgi:hypothetical protein